MSDELDDLRWLSEHFGKATLPEIASALRREKDRADRAEAALRIAVAFMADEEWSAWRSSDGGREDFVGAECCPDCGGMKAHGHLTVCRLVNALGRARAALAGSSGGATP